MYLPQVDGELTRIQESLKDLFHTEIEEARRLLDETANSKAAIELENSRHLENGNQLRYELDQKDKVCNVHLNSSYNYCTVYPLLVGYYN